MPVISVTLLPEASHVVAQFLGCMAQRDLTAAQAFLSPQFEMVFPGGHCMRQLTELVAWSVPRYQRIAKTQLTFEESWQGDQTVVYCRGFLSGEWPDGREFSGIRFVDRFEVQKDKLMRQEVWNDLAEMRV